VNIFGILEKIAEAFQQVSLLEGFSVLCGIVQVLLSKNNKVSNYFFGILGVLSGMYVYFASRLYAEMALNLYYLVMSIYGWWYWTRRTAESPVTITASDRKDWIAVATIVLGGFWLLFLLLAHATDSDVPMWDAAVSCTAWAGMWLLAKRKIENWILLNTSNLIAIPLLFYKELYLFALLTVFLFVVAIFGYAEWRKIMRGEHLRQM